jgi:hypothetical protein
VAGIANTVPGPTSASVPSSILTARPEERRNRELIELLNELRVALPGVQVLFAFLLTIPFANGFPKLSELDRDVYFVALLATLVSTALLLTPSAYHRFVFRRHDKGGCAL